MKRLIFLISLVMTLSSYAEISDTLIEGKSLAGISVVAYSPSRIQLLSDSLLMIRLKSANLGQLMEQRGWANVSSYGPKGMLATARVNGSMSDHTVLYWNNLSLNNPALGLADLSLVPVSFFNKVSFTQVEQQRGIGQGAMAASVALEHRMQEKQLEFSTGINSLLNSFIYGKWASSTKRIRWTTQVQRESNKNEFSYYDSYRLKSPEVFQKNNNAMQTSLMQDAAWTSLNRRNTMDVSLWYLDKKMHIPDLMGITAYYRAAQDDQIKRGSFKYTHLIQSKRRFFHASKVEATAAASHEFQRYTNQLYATNEYSVFSEVTAFTLQKRLAWDNTASSNRWNIMIEARHTDVVVENSNYLNGKKSEPFVTLSGVGSYNIIIQKLFVKSFFYQEWRNEMRSEPSFGGSLHAYFGRRENLKLEFAAAKKFRVPDFNERFWVPGGNRDLLPEDGQQFHALAEFKVIQSKTQKLLLSARWSQLEMHRLIQWIPLDVWTPVNLNDVAISTLEGQLNWSKERGDWCWSLEGRAKWIMANSQTSLIYTPEYSSFVGADVVYRKWDVGYHYRFFSSRFTSIADTRNNVLPAYDVHDVFVGWKSDTTRPVWSLRLSIENILNTRYESIRAYAMPGRVVGLQLNLYPLNIKRAK